MKCVSDINKIGLSFAWIIIQVQVIPYNEPAAIFPTRNFRCANGKYIDNQYFCDGDLKDCGDLSDESLGCNAGVCGSGKFECLSEEPNFEPCIDITGRCNTINDCPDGSDEMTCGDETHIHNCTLSSGKYLCKDKLKCLDFKYACDNVCHCLDCSDESNLCPKFDSQSCSECLHFCLPTPDGPRCICNASDYETSKLCKEIENCTGSSSCSQYCNRYENVTRCLCNENHHEVRDTNGTIKCRSNVWLKTVLLYSTVSKIKALNVTYLNPQTIPNPIIIQNEVNCAGLAAAKDYLYYITNVNNKGSIFKVLINDGKTNLVMELDLSIESLAVDWITNNLYFTSNRSISVCSNNGQICSVLKCCMVNQVALASKFGWMFYTSYTAKDEQLIMKANMDGSEENTLLDVSFANGSTLAVDEWTETVYLFETQMGLLHSCAFNGSINQQHSLSEFDFSPYFSVFEQAAFFTPNHSNEIVRMKNAGAQIFASYRDLNTNMVKQLYVYNPLLQTTYNIVNPCQNSCINTNLCVTHPATMSSADNYLNYTCLCKNFVPTVDNRWCSDNPPIRSNTVQHKSTTPKIEAPHTAESSVASLSHSISKTMISTSTAKNSMISNTAVPSTLAPEMAASWPHGNRWRSDNLPIRSETVQPIRLKTVQHKSTTLKIEAPHTAKSSVASFSHSISKTMISTSTAKSSMISNTAVPSTLAPEMAASWPHNGVMTGIFNILSCLSFVISILTLCLVLRYNYAIRRRNQRVNICEQIEL